MPTTLRQAVKTMKANNPVSAKTVAYLSPGTDRTMSDALVEEEVNSLNCVSTKISNEGSRATIFLFAMRDDQGNSIDAFFMPVDISFGGQHVWHSHRDLHRMDGATKTLTTIRATVWFGKNGFNSAKDLQFTLESRDFATLLKHAIATYAELTGRYLSPIKWSKRVA
jgi:hypothetical protein